MYKKTHVAFFRFSFHKVKYKVARNEKRKKLRGFSYTQNMANFEAESNTQWASPVIIKIENRKIYHY